MSVYGAGLYGAGLYGVGESVIPIPVPTPPVQVYPSMFIDRRGAGREDRTLWFHGFRRGEK